MTNIEPGQGTRKFKPHRADGTRTEVTRQALPGRISPAISLVLLVLGPVWYAEALAQGEPGWPRVMIVVCMTIGAWSIVDYVRGLVRWHRDRG